MLSDFEQVVYTAVLADENTCRMLLENFIKEGIKIEPKVDPKKLTHQQMIDVNIEIIKTIHNGESPNNEVLIH